MSDFSIRAATESDSHLIVSLLRELADYEKLTSGFALDETAVVRDMLGAVCQTALAITEGAAVGIAAWFWIYKSFGAAQRPAPYRIRSMACSSPAPAIP